MANNFNENNFNNSEDNVTDSILRYQKLRQDAAKFVQPEPEIEQEDRIEYDMPIFDEGPLESEIIAWKKQFGKVYSTDIEGDVFIWRPLNRYEYKQIMATPNTNELIREEMICEICVLFPYGYSYEHMVNEAGGIPSMLAEQIMQKSGFTRKVSVMAL